jgi:hypothetical protein
MLPEYDFTDAVRGKYFERYRAGTNVVLLDPDVAAVFPDSATVNRALRELVAVADANVHRRRASVRNQRSNKRLQPTKPRAKSKARPRG